jgi:general secretion pathway protein G
MPTPTAGTPPTPQPTANVRKLGRRSIASGGSAAEAGFTLVELLVVLVILVLLASFVGPRVIGYLGASKSKAARIQIESLASAMELFRLDVGRYPTTAEGVPALVQAPGGVANWSGPYLNKRDAPLDPWGNPFRYAAPGQRGAAFDIVSLGADNQPGGTGENADIANN